MALRFMLLLGACLLGCNLRHLEANPARQPSPEACHRTMLPVGIERAKEGWLSPEEESLKFDGVMASVVLELERDVAKDLRLGELRHLVMMSMVQLDRRSSAGTEQLLGGGHQVKGV
ncbi:hypothetical protein OsI_34974 [Oryza sativa Indica Group]|uniref:Uncharacterized protein n=1 Tax=Oryza sativa subsp. indica TaxID=39946 RepID=A2ZB32_ORYSI|nr:hypothetical protein OsI_34974 [Oryza sativa Indica Group]